MSKTKGAGRPVYRRLYLPSVILFVIIIGATLIGWEAARGTLGSGINLGRAETILLLGVFTAFLAPLVLALLLRASTLDFDAQKDRAVELAKDELLSLASHQMRTPATGVKQYVGMVLQGFAGKVPAKQRVLLEKAYASNDRQLRIINEILHMAKIGSGRIVLSKQPTSLNELVNDIVSEQKPDIESANHKIKINLPKKPVVVSADVHMLRMSIENILSNAIKYTPAGGQITITVGSSKNRAFVSIEDTGVGISTADINRIFDQFSRLHNDMSQQVGGTGIGLYLSKHLAELHGGSVDVQSRPSLGSVFTISLPLGGSKNA